MPVLKVKNDSGIWQDIATANGHTHTVSDIADLPASLVDDVEALKDKVGAHSVAYQVNAAVEANMGYEHPETHPADMITGLAPVATSGNYNDLTNTPTIPSIEGLATERYVQEEIAKINVSGGTGGDGTGTGGSTIVSAVQSDWNQTDNTQMDFIKNKPFGKELGNILDCTFVDSGDGSCMYEDTSSNTLTIGETYTVIWDGVEYTCECLDIETMPAVGNPAALGGEDNGMPFAMARDVSGLAWGVPMWFAMPLVPNDSGEYKCSIPGMVTTKIDLEYLYRPDWNVSNKNNGSYIANKPFGTITAGSVIEEGTVTCTLDFNGLYACIIAPINIGHHAYNVEFDGVNYELLGVEDSSGQVELTHVLDDGTTLFSIIKNLSGDENLCIVAASQGTHTFKITILEDVVQKIDPKYLPDCFGGGSGGSSLPEVTESDNNKVMTVVNGEWAAQTPASGLPEVATSDVGKFLRVNVDGLWIAEAIPSAEEASF